MDMFVGLCRFTYGSNFLRWTEVVASLEEKLKQGKGQPAVAFPVSAQYKKSQVVTDPGKGEGGKKKKPGKKKLKKKKTKAVLPAPSEAKPREIESPTPTVYVPGEYQKIQAQFIQDFLQNANTEGQKPQMAEARLAWANSLKRAQLLCDLSVSELKKRRFIGKGPCSTNPFKERVEQALKA